MKSLSGNYGAQYELIEEITDRKYPKTILPFSSRETEGSKQALEDLCEFLFMDWIDRAIRQDNPNET